MTTICGKALVIHVTAKGGRGSFYVEERRRGEHYWCQLTCNTDWGVVGHIWNSMGEPAASFLAGCDKDYLLNKLWGLKLHEFDGAATVESVRSQICRGRRDGAYGKRLAQEWWETLGEVKDPSVEEWRDILNSRGSFFEEFYEAACYRNNSQAEGFWRTLWPEFITALVNYKEPVHVPE